MNILSNEVLSYNCNFLTVCSSLAMLALVILFVLLEASCLLPAAVEANKQVRYYAVEFIAINAAITCAYICYIL